MSDAQKDYIYRGIKRNIDNRQKMSRNAFLKIITAAGGATTLFALGEKLKRDIDRMDKYPRYLEIEEGDLLPLKLNGSDNYEGYKILYSKKEEGLRDNLQMRKEKDKEGNYQTVMPVPFNPNARTVRKVGEILDLTLFELKKNEIISDEIEVGYYNYAGPVDNTTIGGRKTLSNNARVKGLKVITFYNDYLREGDLPPFEINDRNVDREGNTINDRNLSKFGEGWAIGKIDPETKTFLVLGYVTDARALEVVKP